MTRYGLRSSMKLLKDATISFRTPENIIATGFRITSSQLSIALISKTISDAQSGILMESKNVKSLINMLKNVFKIKKIDLMVKQFQWTHWNAPQR